MNKTGIIVIVFALATIVLTVIVAQEMRDSSFIARAYGVTAIIIAFYTWSVARRLDQAKKAKARRAPPRPSRTNPRAPPIRAVSSYS